MKPFMKIKIEGQFQIINLHQIVYIKQIGVYTEFWFADGRHWLVKKGFDKVHKMFSRIGAL